MTVSVEKKKDDRAIVVKMVLDSWKTQNARIDKFLAEVSDEQLAWPAVLGRNSALYVIGHLTAVTDGLLPILGWGIRKYPDLEEVFITNPFDIKATLPTAADVRQAWRRVNGIAEQKFGEVSPEEWFERHTSVTEEDFEKEPHRNRLNVIINRTNHQSYHLGQFALLLKKEEN
ncbi:MAG: DinB family protein [Acidobacteriota bacterium]